LAKVVILAKVAILAKVVILSAAKNPVFKN